MFTPSSSLPALEGALESSKGEAKGPYLLSLLPSEVQLVLRDEKPASLGDLTGDKSSRNLLEGLDLVGGNSKSLDSAGALEVYGLLGEGAVPGLWSCCATRDLADGCLAVPGLCCRSSIVLMLLRPELSRRRGVSLVGGEFEELGDDMRRGKERSLKGLFCPCSAQHVCL